MRFEDKEITLKDGRNCILRPTLPEYAGQMIEYLKKTSAETPDLLRNPDEVDFTLEVVAENTQAQSLYKKCGFVETGRRHNALLFDDGTYHDEILMYKSLK